MLVGDVWAGNDLPTRAIPMLDEPLAAAVIPTDCPHVTAGNGADRQEVVGSSNGWVGDTSPIRAIPVLNDLVRRNAKVAIGADCPHVVRRDRCHAKEVVVRKASIGAWDDVPA